MESGYYFVSYKDKQQIAYYNSEWDLWQFMGTHQRDISEKVTLIYNERIRMPDEK